MKKLLRYFLFTIGLVFLTLIITLAVFFKFDIPVEELKKTYANEESEFIEVEGMQIHYRDEGKGEIIVLLHGTAASLHTWDVWTEKLKEKYRVVRLDLPAYGLTGSHPEHKYDYESYVRVLHHFLEKLDIQKFHLAGNSLGGRIAWAYALSYPEEVDKLILVDASGYPTGKPRPFVFRLARTPILNGIVRYVTPHFFFRRNLEQVYGNDNKITDETIQRYYDMNLREDNREAFIERAKTDYNNDASQIKNIQSPTLILWGEEDTWIPVENAYKFDKDIPNSKLVTFKGAGHVPMEEIPEETVQAVLEFLGE